MTCDAWLVVVDMQVIFGEPTSPWFVPDYPTAEAATVQLIERFGTRVVFTRFVAPEVPKGVWADYYRLWPFAFVPETNRLFDLMPRLAGTKQRVVSRPTFNKWDAELASIINDGADLILVGVSSDCCVLATALTAADAGRHVLVVGDACAGTSVMHHRRALDTMALFSPHIQIISAVDVDI